MRLLHTKEEENEQALVHVYPYFEEIQEEMSYANMQMIPRHSSFVPEMEILYQMDHKILMFIANNGMGRPMPTQNQRLFKPLALGPCYGCGETIGIETSQIRKIKPQEYHP